MNVLFMYLSNDREHVAACQRKSLIHKNSLHPLHRCNISKNHAVAPLFTSIRRQMTTRQLVAFALPQMRWHGLLRCSARLKRRNTGTTVLSPKGLRTVYYNNGNGSKLQVFWAGVYTVVCVVLYRYFFPRSSELFVVFLARNGKPRIKSRHG